VVTFGDGENDIELIEEAGFGIAVGRNPLLPTRRLDAGPEEEGVAVIDAYLESLMIDLRAARAEPDAGGRPSPGRARQAFDELLAADDAGAPRARVDDLRGARLKGKPTPSSSRSCSAQGRAARRGGGARGRGTARETRWRSSRILRTSRARRRYGRRRGRAALEAPALAEE
jgi:hypothetical protein